MIRIFLNTIANSPEPLVNYGWFEVTNDCNGIENLTMSVSYVDNVVQRGITNQVSFVDAAYDFIFDKLVNDVNGEHIWVRVEIDGFNYVFPYMQIKYNGIEWCSNACKIDANLVTWDSDIDAYRKLKNELIWDEEFLADLGFYNEWEGNYEQAHPLMLLYKKKGTYDWGYGVVGVFARHYFYNLCKKVNLAPSSSIFNYQGLNSWTGDDYDDPYYVSSSNSTPANNPQSKKLNPYHTSAIFLNKYNNGDESVSDYAAWAVGKTERPSPIALTNALNLNGFQYLQKLSPVFNAKFRVVNGQLVFERKDYFYQTSTLWLDLSDKKVCLKLKTQDNWAYLRLEYGDEATMFNGAKPELATVNYDWATQYTSTMPPLATFAEKFYTEIVEWNKPPSSRQEGEKTEVLEFSSLRESPKNGIKYTNSERYAYDVTNYAIDEPIICCLREDEPMNRKLLWQNYEIEPETDTAQGYYQRSFNKYMWTKYVSDTIDLRRRHFKKWRGTLYDNFHFIDDPRRRPNSQGYEAKEPYKRFEYEMDIDLNCDSLDTFSLDKYILTSEGKASMESVIFDFKKMTAKIKGFI